MGSRRHQNSGRTSCMSNVRLERTSVSNVTKTTCAEWSELPEDILCLVVDRIVDAKDFIRFRLVCKDWCSAIPRSYWKRTPWVLAKRYKTPVVVLKGLSSLCPSNISLSSLFETELHWRFWGSFTGWILGQHPSDYSLKLINPLTKDVIDLPRLNHSVRKGLVYQTPDSDSDSRTPSIGVMAISHSFNGIAMINNKFKHWTFLTDMEDVQESNFVDLVWYKNKLVALRANGAIVFFNETTAVRSLHSTPVIVRHDDELYLVESSGDLLITTKSFKVYRLNLDTEDWMQVIDLGRHSLFVGKSYSMSLWIPEQETENDWRPSCIYNATYSSTSSGKLSCYNITKKREEDHHIGPVTDLDKCYDFIWYMPAVGFI